MMMNKEFDNRVILQSTIECPECHSKQLLDMPEDYCLWFYDCPSCGLKMKPLEGDCCGFCSFGDVPCPPIQLDKGCCQS